MDDTGCTLTLFGSFGPASLPPGGMTWPPAQPLREPLIHGIAEGIRFSVVNSECHWPRPPRALGTEQWRAEAAIEAHLELPAEGQLLLYSGLGIDLQHLARWARAPGFDQRFYYDSERIEVGVQPHTLESCALPSGVTLTIRQGIDSETIGDTEGVAIRHPVAVWIDDTTPATWQSLLNTWLQPIQVLVWLATATPGWVDRLWVRTRNIDGDLSWARLWLPLVQPLRESDLLPGDLLFFARDLPGGFCKGLERWLLLWEELQHVIGPLFSRVRAPFTYANDRLYTAVAAIEAYHRYCTDTARDLPKAEHKARVERLATVLRVHAPDLEEWAVNAARPFNHRAIWRRIVDVAECTGLVGTELLANKAEPFARAVEKARHGQAHALAGSESPLGDSGRLYLAATAVTWLLRFGWLVDLGFPTHTAEASILRNSQFQWAVSSLRPTLSDLG